MLKGSGQDYVRIRTLGDAVPFVHVRPEHLVICKGATYFRAQLEAQQLRAFQIAHRQWLD